MSTKPTKPTVVPTAPPWASSLVTIGTTGTNGKSTTTTWIARILSALGPPAPFLTTLGAYVGSSPALDVPKNHEGFLRTMRRGLDGGARHAAVELTSEALSQGWAKTWPITVGVFTNLSHDHLDKHVTLEHYLASKAQLFQHVAPGGTVVLNAADETSELLREVVPPGTRVLTYAVPDRGTPVLPVDLAGVVVGIDAAGTHVELRGGEAFDVPSSIHLRCHGSIFAENALAALLATWAVGVPASLAIPALESAEAPDGRFSIVCDDPIVAVDFAHTPDALERTLATARALAKGRVTLVFGAGGERDPHKRPVMGRAARAADRVILTNDNPRREAPESIAQAVREGLGDHADVVVELDRARAIDLAVAAAKTGDVVLVAGKGHETTQTIGTATVPFSDADECRKAVVRAGFTPRGTGGPGSRDTR